jgi:hypothetical protein
VHDTLFRRRVAERHRTARPRAASALCRGGASEAGDLRQVTDEAHDVDVGGGGAASDAGRLKAVHGHSVAIGFPRTCRQHLSLSSARFFPRGSTLPSRKSTQGRRPARYSGVHCPPADGDGAGAVAWPWTEATAARIAARRRKRTREDAMPLVAAIVAARIYARSMLLLLKFVDVFDADGCLCKRGCVYRG